MPRYYHHVGICATRRSRPGAAPASRPHQNGFNDVLALAQLNGVRPSASSRRRQPVELAHFGGSLRDAVRARLPEVVALAAQELAAWDSQARRGR